MTPVRILHCDDSESVQALVAALLAPHAGVELIEQVDCHDRAVERAAALQPDLVLLDLDAGRDEHVVERLRETCAASIIVLSGDSDLYDDSIVQQADGSISKTVGSLAISAAILSAATEHDDLWLRRATQPRPAFA
jgi:DNA-binding NarL/FixJ family response regulator